MEFADGTVEQIYCHWDGYLDHNGMILYKHYVDPFKTRDLIDLGDLSSLRPNIGSQHSFDKGPEGECTFYKRDRNESGTMSKKFKDYADYIDNHQYEEYEYILRRDGFWYVADHDASYVLLADAIADQLIAESQEEETL
jgi:hypothetical protein